MLSEFNVNIVIDEKILFSGYDIKNKEMSIPNMILIFAEYTIYRVHMLCRFKAIRFNHFYLALEFKKEMIMNLKFLQKRRIVTVSENLIVKLKTL